MRNYRGFCAANHVLIAPLFPPFSRPFLKYYNALLKNMACLVCCVLPETLTGGYKWLNCPGPRDRRGAALRPYCIALCIGRGALSDSFDPGPIQCCQRPRLLLFSCCYDDHCGAAPGDKILLLHTIECVVEYSDM